MALKQEFVVAPQELWVTAKSMDNSEEVMAIKIMIVKSKKKQQKMFDTMFQPFCYAE